MNPASSYAPPDLSGLRGRALVVGIVGLVATGAGFAMNAKQAFQSYLLGFLLVASVAIGCLAISLLHHMSRGAWGLMIRRILEAGSRTLPAVLILFVPVALGIKSIFPWADPAVHQGLPHNQQIYLTDTAVILRAVVYFALFSILAFVLSSMSRKQDETGDPMLARRMQLIAGPGILVYAFAASFASFDWVMSLNSKWFSSIFGVHFIVGHLLAAMSFVILMLSVLAKQAPMQGVYQKRHFHDYGKLLLAFTLVWAYLSLSQFLIIWSGNLPEEIEWYMVRSEASWKAFTIFLIFGHFVIPFALLLSAARKKDIHRMVPVAIWMLLMRHADNIWQTTPAIHHHSMHIHWLDFTAAIGLGGVWVWLFLGQLQKASLLPVNEPNLPAALEVASHG